LSTQILLTRRIDELEELFPDFPLGPESEREFSTFGGFTIQALGHIPRTGEHFMAGVYRVEIVDLDRNRIDKVLISPPAVP